MDYCSLLRSMILEHEEMIGAVARRVACNTPGVRCDGERVFIDMDATEDDVLDLMDAYHEIIGEATVGVTRRSMESELLTPEERSAILDQF